MSTQPHGADDQVLVRNRRMMRMPLRRAVLAALPVGISAGFYSAAYFHPPTLSESLLFHGLHGIGAMAIMLTVYVPRAIGMPAGREGMRYSRLSVGVAVLAILVLVRFGQPYLFCGVAILLWILELGLLATWLAFHAYRNFARIPMLQELAVGVVPAGDCPALFAHVTDVHVTVADNIQRKEGGEGGYQSLVRWTANIGSPRPSYIIISGDMTDSAAPAEWERTENALKSLTAGPIIVCPGNHDLAPAYDATLRGRFRRYGDFQHSLCPELRSHDGRTWGDVVSRLRAQGGASEDALLESLWKEWLQLFPFSLYDPQAKLLIVTLNSNASYGSVAESAIGHFGKEQLSRLDEVLNSVPEGCQSILIVTHHAVARHPGDDQLLQASWFVKPRWWKQIKNRVMEFALTTFEDTDELKTFSSLVERCGQRYPEKQIFVVCGHRHTKGAGRLAPATVLEGGSLAEHGASAWLVYRDGSHHAVLEEPLHAEEAH